MIFFFFFNIFKNTYTFLFAGSSNCVSRGRGRGNNTPSRNAIVKEEKQEKPDSSQWRPQFPHPVVEDIDLCVRGKLSKFPGTGKIIFFILFFILSRDIFFKLSFVVVCLFLFVQRSSSQKEKRLRK